MADPIKCPVCGENNPADQEFCKNCQSRLQAAKGTDSLIKPGQAPTKKTTAELEPILPQWLREARDSSRTTDPQEVAQVSQRPEHKQPADSSEDFLAGLTSQSGDDDEDDTPDWLANITGAAPKPKKSTPESSGARRVELGGIGDFAQEESPADNSETPSWLAGLTPTESQADEKDELTDWFRNADDSNPIETPKEPVSFDDTFSSASSIDDTPDWLRQMSADEDAKKAQQSPSSTPISGLFSSDSSDTPDWLRQMAAGQEDTNQQPASFEIPANPASTNTDSEAPDWLHQIASDETLISSAPATDETNAAEEFSVDIPDWLRGVEDNTQSADTPNLTESGSGKPRPPALVSTGELPAWLNDQADTTPKPTQETTPKWLKKDEPASVTGELPAWLSSSEETVHIPETPKDNTPAKSEPAQDDVLGDLPDWLKASAPQSTLFEAPAEASAEEPADTSFDTPDWLNTFKPVEESQPSEKESSLEIPSSFNEDEQAGKSTDNLFAAMPDWLSNAMELPDTPTPITNTDAIAPGELPSWVQAMRPVDAAPSSLSSSLAFSSDKTLESRGALAGLQGVLPSVPGFTPTSKPKAYSIRLRASEEQQSQAALLEQILAAETAPVPIASFSALQTSRGLRWFLTIMIFMVVITGLVLGTPIFSMPLGVPREIGRTVEISHSLPQGAPVLVAFDFESARVGEMEAAAAPFFDQMIFYSHPNLTFISSNETGSLLVERFISGPLADHYKNSGFTYLNLGYLPGGQLGIRAFAQNPRSTTPLDISLQPAWTSTPNELNSLPQLYMAMVLVTDSADAARVWIEQTENARGSMPVIVISSAQAAPMIQPYFESQQIRGMVAGLYGGAVFEQSNSGSIKNARNYWDAYSLGMLLAMSLVLGGGLWNLVLGLRDRTSAREAK